jgi:hypothetical protein
MPINTYATLKAAVADFMHRTDLTSQIETAVSLTEADIATDVRCQAQELIVTGTLSSDVLAFPADFVDAKRLTVAGDVHRYVTPEVYAEKLTQGSTDHNYTVIGQAFYVLRGGTSPYALTYWKKFAALSADADTNWLLTNHPDVYLYGALRHLAIFTSDDVAAQKYMELSRMAVSRVNAREAKAAIAGGPLQMYAANVE